MEKFIECSDLIGKAVGEGYFSKNEDYLHVVTSDIEVAKFFKKRNDEDSKVMDLVLKRNRRKKTFPFSLTIIEFDETRKDEWIIKMKKNNLQ